MLCSDQSIEDDQKRFQFVRFEAIHRIAPFSASSLRRRASNLLAIATHSPLDLGEALLDVGDLHRFQEPRNDAVDGCALVRRDLPRGNRRCDIRQRSRGVRSGSLGWSAVGHLKVGGFDASLLKLEVRCFWRPALI